MNIEAPVWSAQEMVDLLEAVAFSADRGQLSLSEAANISRSAAHMIRYMQQEINDSDCRALS